MALVKNTFSWLDLNIEKIIILLSYAAMAGIIFVEVVRRFLFNQQVPWSTTIPVLLFLWLTWFGASYNVKQRTHLALTEIRARLPYKIQFGCFVLDAILWLAFAVIVIYYTVGQTYLAYDNFAIVGGTDNVMEWWFYLATPLAWVLIMLRVVQNLLEDIERYKNQEPFIFQAPLD